MTTKPSLFWVDPEAFSDLIRRTKRAGESPGRGAALRRALVRDAPVGEKADRGAAVRDAAIRAVAVRDAAVKAAAAADSESHGVRSAEVGPERPAAPQGSARALSPLPKNLDEGSLEDRLRALLSWIHPELDLAHTFVVGDDGLALVEQGEPEAELIAAAAELAHAWDQLHDQFALSSKNFLVADLVAQNRLHILSVRTGWGLMSLGLVTSRPVSEPHADLIAEGFRLALIEKEPHTS